MERHHQLAIAGSAGLSAIALTDAVTHGLTGSWSVFMEESGHTGAIIGSYVVHGLAYLALAHVLRREAARFTSTPKAARGARRVLIVAFAVLGVGMIAVAPAVLLTGSDAGVFGAVWGLAGLTLLVSLLLASAVLGLAVLRSNPLGAGGRVLGVVIPILLATVALGFLAPDWAHPAYLETVINVGAALVGVGAGRAAVPAHRPVRRTPTTA